MNLLQLSRLTEDEARAHLESIRWPNGSVCPHCASTDVVTINGHSPKVRPGLKRCKTCRKQFTVTSGTVMHRSHLPLRLWAMAFHLMCASKKGISAHQLHRELGVAYTTAWFLAHRVRCAMEANPPVKLSGTVEADETYVGGKTREGWPGRASERKTPVLVLVERGGESYAKPVERVTAKELKGAIRERVCRDATVMTDEFPSYRGLGREFAGHGVVRHGDGEYSSGEAHVNTAESWFALLKRGVNGTFHHVSKRHLHRYCNEFAFRWNQRRVTDGQRTIAAIRSASGKRLTYRRPKGGAEVVAAQRD